MTCAHCGVCHASHDNANKNGGVGHLFDWNPESEPYCPVCQDKRSEWEAEAIRYRIAQSSTTDTEQTTLL